MFALGRSFRKPSILQLDLSVEIQPYVECEVNLWKHLTRRKGEGGGDGADAVSPGASDVGAGRDSTDLFSVCSSTPHLWVLPIPKPSGFCSMPQNAWCRPALCLHRNHSWFGTLWGQFLCSHSCPSGVVLFRVKLTSLVVFVLWHGWVCVWGLGGCFPACFFPCSSGWPRTHYVASVGIRPAASFCVYLSSVKTAEIRDVHWHTRPRVTLSKILLSRALTFLRNRT